MLTEERRAVAGCPEGGECVEITVNSLDEGCDGEKSEDGEGKEESQEGKRRCGEFDASSHIVVYISGSCEFIRSLLKSCDRIRARNILKNLLNSKIRAGAF